MADLQRENEKLSLQVKDLTWQLNQVKDEHADRKRQVELELQEARGRAAAASEATEQEFERQRAKLVAEHEEEVAELKKMHEESLKASLQKVYAEYDGTVKQLSHRNEQLESELGQTNMAAENMVHMHRENLAEQVQSLHQELNLIQAEMRAKEEKLRQERDNAQLKALKALKKLDKLQSAPKPEKTTEASEREQQTALKADREAQMLQTQQMRAQFRQELDLLAEENSKLKETVKRVRAEKQEAEDICDQLEQKARALVKEKYRI